MVYVLRAKNAGTGKEARMPEKRLRDFALYRFGILALAPGAKVRRIETHELLLP